MWYLNLGGRKEWKQSAFFQDSFVRDAFPSVYRFTTPTCHNAVIALLRQKKTVREFRSRLRTQPDLDERNARCRLRYKVSRIA